MNNITSVTFSNMQSVVHDIFKIKEAAMLENIWIWKLMVARSRFSRTSPKLPSKKEESLHPCFHLCFNETSTADGTMLSSCSSPMMANPTHSLLSLRGKQFCWRWALSPTASHLGVSQDPAVYLFSFHLFGPLHQWINLQPLTKLLED